MPRLPIYNNQVELNPAPVARAANDAAQSGYYQGRALEQGFNDLARGITSVQNDMAQKQKAEEALKTTQEIGNLTVGMAQTQADLAVKWQDYLRTGDPNDPNLYQKFMDEVATPAFDKLGENISTQKGNIYFQTHRAKAWASMYKSAATDTSKVNAEHAVNQVTTMSKSYSDAAYFDPTNWKDHVEQSDGAIDALADAHGLPATKVEELKTKQHALIVTSATDGMIKQNPEEALKVLQEGTFNGFLDGKQTDAAIKKAEGAIRTQASDAKATDAAETKKKKLEGINALNELEGQVVIDPVDGHHTLPPDYFTKLNDIRDKYGDVIDPGTFNAAINWGAVELRRNKTKMDVSKSDPAKYKEMLEKATDGTLTREEVYTARGNNFLSQKDFTFFKDWVGTGKNGGDSAQRTELKKINGITKMYKGYIDDSVGDSFKDTWGKTRFSEFQSDMIEKWGEMKAAGKTEADFEEYVKRAIPLYTFKRSDVTDMFRRKAKGETIVPPSVEPPDIGAEKKPLDQFFKEGAIMNKFEGNPNVDLAAYHQPEDVSTAIDNSDGRSIPIFTKQLATRQPISLEHMNPVVLSKWERVQGVLGFRIPVLSAYRDPVTNRLAKGANKSEHMHGNAIDVDVSHMSPKEQIHVIEVASALGFTGVGVYGNSLHFDVGGRRAWGPDHHAGSLPAWARGVIDMHMRNGYASESNGA